MASLALRTRSHSQQLRLTHPRWERWQDLRSAVEITRGAALTREVVPAVPAKTARPRRLMQAAGTSRWSSCTDVIDDASARSRCCAADSPHPKYPDRVRIRRKVCEEKQCQRRTPLGDDRQARL